MNETGGHADRARERPERLRDGSDATGTTVRDTTEGDRRSLQAVDAKGRPVAVVEGRVAPDGSFLVEREQAARGPEGVRGRAAIDGHLTAGGVDLRAARPDDAASPRPDISSQHPDDYLPSTPEDHDRLRDLRASSDDPRQWIEAVNPGHGVQRADLDAGRPVPPLNRVHNCMDAARSVQDTIDGHPRAAAAGTFEGFERTEAWAGRPAEVTSFASLKARLQRPGDSAVVVAIFDNGRGHAFNAVNIDGKVSYVDGQTGEVSDWPPPFASDTVSLHAWHFGRDDAGGR